MREADAAATETTVVTNPILPGFNPDPAIVRRGGDYYIATSTFEWLPAVQIHHSVDLVTWTLVGHALTGSEIDLRGVHASGGIWAPCLTVDPQTGRFFLVFGVMKSQTAEVFDVDNYVIWTDDIGAGWSKPLYVNSLGFDSSLFHDDDGTKWLVTLEWETRPSHEHPGWIVAQSFDPATGDVGPPVRIHHGTTDRGAMEAPHLYTHRGTYYLMTAEGGTGFGHGVCLARAQHLTGPYESDPESPFITSSPEPYFGRNHRDFLRPERFHADTALHKAGHGSLVETPDGRWFVAHLSSRVVPGTRASILGRETSLQSVRWTDDGWLRLTGGGILAEEVVSVPATAVRAGTSLDVVTDFREPLSPHFAAPRVPIDASWCTTGATGLVMRGRDSLHSLFDVSLLATRVRGFDATCETTLRFDPTHFSQSAGLTLFYDQRTFLYARISYDEEARSRTVALIRAAADSPTDAVVYEEQLPQGAVDLRAEMHDGRVTFSWRSGESEWVEMGGAVDSTFMSDEAVHGFTGQFVGVTVADGVSKRATARVTRFELRYPADGEPAGA